MWGCREKPLAPQGIVDRNDASVRRRGNLPLVSGVVRGDVPESVEVRMNGLAFGADLVGGQKTGIYLDQRENYLAAARYAHGHALDCFTSSGGFALHMAAKCESVEAADRSAAALALAGENRQSNHAAHVGFHQAGAVEVL